MGMGGFGGRRAFYGICRRNSLCGSCLDHKPSQALLARPESKLKLDEEGILGLLTDLCVILPRLFPKLVYDVHILLSGSVALIMVHHFISPHSLSCAIGMGGYYIPAYSTITEMV